MNACPRLWQSSKRPSGAASVDSAWAADEAAGPRNSKRVPSMYA